MQRELVKLVNISLCFLGGGEGLILAYKDFLDHPTQSRMYHQVYFPISKRSLILVFVPLFLLTRSAWLLIYQYLGQLINPLKEVTSLGRLPCVYLLTNTLIRSILYMQRKVTRSRYVIEMSRSKGNSAQCLRIPKVHNCISSNKVTYSFVLQILGQYFIEVYLILLM